MNGQLLKKQPSHLIGRTVTVLMETIKGGKFKKILQYYQLLATLSFNGSGQTYKRNTIMLYKSIFIRLLCTMLAIYLVNYDRRMLTRLASKVLLTYWLLE